MIDSNYFARDLCILCECLYRKGAYDSATEENKTIVNNIYQRADYDTLQFVECPPIPLKKYDRYLDILFVYMNKHGCTYLSRILKTKGSGRFAKGVCLLAEYTYRRGLRDGKKATPEAATHLYESFGKGNYKIFKKLLSKGSFSLIEYKDWLKYHCGLLSNSLYETKFISQVDKVRNLIYDSLTRDYIE